MNNKWIIILMFLVLYGLYDGMSDSNQGELMKNGGFEGDTHVLPFGKNLVMPKHWGHWNPKIIIKLIEDEKNARSGRKFIQAKCKKKGCRILSNKVKLDPYKKYLVQAWVKGDCESPATKTKSKKKFGIAVYEYALNPQSKFSGGYSVKPDKKFKVSDKWQLFRGIYQPRCKERAPNYNVTLAVNMSDGIYVDDVSFKIYDPRELSERIAAFKFNEKLDTHRKRLQDDPKLKEKFGSRLGEIEQKINILQQQCKEGMTFEKAFDLERQFDELTREYEKFRYEIAFDGITF